LTRSGEQLDAFIGRLQGSKRTGENGLLHGHALQLLLSAGPMHTTLGETDGEQGQIGGLFLLGGLWGEFDRAPFLEVTRDLVPDIFLEATNDQPFVAIILRRALSS
jgi:hypothetical protein